MLITHCNSNVGEKQETDVFGTCMLNHFYDEVNKDRQTKNITEVESEGYTWDVGKFARSNHPLQMMVGQWLSNGVCKNYFSPSAFIGP